MTQVKPMLAGPAGELKFPVLVSPKIDGVRALVKDGVLLSRSLKPIRNKYVQALFGRPEYEGFDGELVVGDAAAANVMQATTSGVMAIEGEPDVGWFVFDLWDCPALPYYLRNNELGNRCAQLQGERVVHLVQHLMRDQSGVDLCEASALEAGFEGLMVRSPEAPYKYGRSTAKEGYLLKVKRFEDGEAVVVGFEERMHNGNEATTNALGHTERSTHQANKVGRGDLGALVCNITLGGAKTKDGREQSTGSKVCFNVGTGFSDEQRAALWAQRDTLVGRIVKFKHFAATGVVDAPRHPVFIGFRDPIDMSFDMPDASVPDGNDWSGVDYPPPVPIDH